LGADWGWETCSKCDSEVFEVAGRKKESVPVDLDRAYAQMRGASWIVEEAEREALRKAARRRAAARRGPSGRGKAA
jgi:hypothetical protein